MMREADMALATLLTRARSEYNGRPGLRLVAAQAARLWATDRSTSQRVLDDLVRAGFLWRTRDGHYLRHRCILRCNPPVAIRDGKLITVLNLYGAVLMSDWT